MDKLFGQRNHHNGSFQRVNADDIAKHRLTSNTGCSKFINQYIDTLLHDGGLAFKHIRKNDTCISSLIKEVISNNPKFDSSLFSTNIDFHEELYVDTKQIKFVVDKVLDNALNYNSGKEITEIQLQKGPRSVVLSVKDKGIGIDPFEKNKIFLPFYRGIDSSAFSKGIGLGLTLSKEILLNNEAEIYIDSQGHGLGTSVFISFPYEDKHLVYKKAEQKVSQIPQAVSC